MRSGISQRESAVAGEKYTGRAALVRLSNRRSGGDKDNRSCAVPNGDVNPWRAQAIFALILLQVFALVALILAAIGIYGF